MLAAFLAGSRTRRSAAEAPLKACRKSCLCVPVGTDFSTPELSTAVTVRGLNLWASGISYRLVMDYCGCGRAGACSKQFVTPPPSALCTQWSYMGGVMTTSHLRNLGFSRRAFLGTAASAGTLLGRPLERFRIGRCPQRHRRVQAQCYPSGVRAIYPLRDLHPPHAAHPGFAFGKHQ
jgi:hypothetical protein